MADKRDAVRGQRDYSSKGEIKEAWWVFFSQTTWRLRRKIESVSKWNVFDDVAWHYIARLWICTLCIWSLGCTWKLLPFIWFSFCPWRQLCYAWKCLWCAQLRNINASQSRFQIISAQLLLNSQIFPNLTRSLNSAKIKCLALKCFVIYYLHMCYFLKSRTQHWSILAAFEVWLRRPCYLRSEVKASLRAANEAALSQSTLRGSM